MRAVLLDSDLVMIKGSPMTLLYYKREFDRSMNEDFILFATKANTGSELEDDDFLMVLQMIWAMAKTAADGQLVNFDRWLESFEDIDLKDYLSDVVTEAMHATYVGDKKKDKARTEPEPEDDDVDIEIRILTTAKRVGLSLSELNQMTLAEFMAFINHWTGKQSDEGSRMATQTDIDNFYLFM